MILEQAAAMSSEDRWYPQIHFTLSRLMATMLSGTRSLVYGPRNAAMGALSTSMWLQFSKVNIWCMAADSAVREHQHFRSVL